MKTATAKELRNRAAAILESVRKGNEVVITMRGEPVATLKPFKKNEKKFNPVGFGMWKDRKDLKDAAQWLNERRKERFQR
ncbi:MAG: type II toxin-antitoxin system prevent-host-death family antitoxin [Nitrospirota bacterium]